MSEADKDGRVLRSVQDMHAVLGMEINESVIESRQRFAATLSEVRQTSNRRGWRRRLPRWRQ